LGEAAVEFDSGLIGCGEVAGRGVQSVDDFVEELREFVEGAGKGLGYRGS
jgi:hypothetical protein